MCVITQKKMPSRQIKKVTAFSNENKQWNSLYLIPVTLLVANDWYNWAWIIQTRLTTTSWCRSNHQAVRKDIFSISKSVALSPNINNWLAASRTILISLNHPFRFCQSLINHTLRAQWTADHIFVLLCIGEPLTVNAVN